MAAQEDAGGQGTEDEVTEEFVAHRPVTSDRGGSEGVRKKVQCVIPFPYRPVPLVHCVAGSL